MRRKRVRSQTVDAPTPEKLRLRLAAWARYAFVKMRMPSVAEMARRMPHSQAALNDIIGGIGSPGIDFAVKLALFAQESLDRFCLTDPPAHFEAAGIPTQDTPLTPKRASVEPATPRKRGNEGGQ
jgi:hypothetical protein